MSGAIATRITGNEYPLTVMATGADGHEVEYADAFSSKVAKGYATKARKEGWRNVRVRANS